MFGIGLPELLLIMVLALIVIGPEKLPDLAKTLGKIFYEFKNVVDGVKSSIAEEEKNLRKDLPVQSGSPADITADISAIGKKGEALMKDYEDAILNRSKDKKVKKVSQVESEPESEGDNKSV